MAASVTVTQLSSHHNSSRPFSPSRGVLTLSGYGISVRVNRGHLIVEDGIGSTRHSARFARVGHGLRRLVVIGADGSVSLAALRWLADQDAAFSMLDRDGTVLLATGPVGPKDARLRRAQALAHQNGLAVSIARELLGRKLTQQARNARDHFGNQTIAGIITATKEALASVETVRELRQVEAQAALAYWSLMRTVAVEFPRSVLARVPEHWRVFGTRHSPLTNSPRLSVNPPNAMLNYLYALLESESRLAAAALGLDPGLAFLHADASSRDSLACDLMEPLRPEVDAYVLNWLQREPLRREWFFEQPNGNCRLMASFASYLAETSSTWAQRVAPIAEWVARSLSASFSQSRRLEPPTLLTQRHRREAKGAPPREPAPPPEPPRVCRSCGVELRSGQRCATCGQARRPERPSQVSAESRNAARPSADARRRAVTSRRLVSAEEWKPSDQPVWLTEEVYHEQIQPRLGGVSAARLAAALAVSKPEAIAIRGGEHRPHPRHWRALAELTGVAFGQ
jgi:CRISPR-associated endonuclease Cas1